MTLKGFLAGFGLAVILLAAMLVYRSFYVHCPCGFKYDAFSGGCVVDLNPPPCTDQEGGSSPGGKSGAGGPHTYVSPPNPPFPSRCFTEYVTNCALRPDWKAVEFTLVEATGTIPAGPPPQWPVALSIAQRDKNGGTCATISGVVDVPLNVPTTIPIDAAALSGLFPLTSSTTPAMPTTGLIVNISESCRAALTQMAVVPTRKPECGCKVAFSRDTLP